MNEYLIPDPARLSAYQLSRRTRQPRGELEVEHLAGPARRQPVQQAGVIDHDQHRLAAGPPDQDFRQL